VWAVGACLGLFCVVLGLVIAGGIGTAVALVGFAVIVAICAAALRSHRRRRPRPPPRSR
jgi:membrane protein implicated in regulation of membrane protease activity